MSVDSIVDTVPASPAHPHAEGFTCANCGAVNEGEYCSRCGQKRVHDGDLSLAHAWHHLVHEMLHFDGRILQSIGLLFTRPGQLTLDFLEGRRARHVHPVRLFLVFSAIFFVVSTSGVTAPRFYGGRNGERVQEKLHAKAAAEGVAYETLVGRIDLRISLAFKVAYTACVVACGVWFWLFFRRQRPYLAEHMVMALHLACVAMTFAMVLSLFFDRAPGNPWPVTSYTGGLVSAFMVFAGRRVYGDHFVRLTTIAVLWVTSSVAVPLKAAMVVLDRSLR